MYFNSNIFHWTKYLPFQTLLISILCSDTGHSDYLLRGFTLSLQANSETVPEKSHKLFLSQSSQLLIHYIGRIIHPM
jgi:hypothetical protein